MEKITHLLVCDGIFSLVQLAVSRHGCRSQSNVEIVTLGPKVVQDMLPFFQWFMVATILY